MSATFLAAVSARARDEELHRLIAMQITYDSALWRIEHRVGAGRCLVANCAIPAATKIFAERPIVVAKGGSAAIAKAVLRLDRSSNDFLAVSQLHSPVEKDQADFGPWAAGLAANNVHGAGGNLINPSADRRAVLGLLASMMMHECCPSCVTYIASGPEGSLVSLHTVRPLMPGEPLSISYVGAYQPTARRRELLLRQHRFICRCPRCTVLPEHTRAFRCPNCEEGPCSPASPDARCRDLVCDSCECTMRMDDEAWKRLVDAETSETITAEAISVLHPYHHMPVQMYQCNLLKLSPAQRADVLRQQADARTRLYRSFCAAKMAHPLVANDIEGVGVALLAAGETARAADTFLDAAGRFATFYGEGSADAQRCAAAAKLKRIDEYQALGAQRLEVLAHH